MKIKPIKAKITLIINNNFLKNKWLKIRKKKVRALRDVFLIIF